MEGGWAVHRSPYGVVDSGCRVMLVAFEFDGVFYRMARLFHPLIRVSVNDLTECLYCIWTLLTRREATRVKTGGAA